MTAPASPLDLDALERLPPDGQIVYVPGGVAYRRDGAWYSLTGYGWPGALIDWPVTWWLPLDALPDLIAAARERDALLQRAERAEQRAARLIGVLKEYEEADVRALARDILAGLKRYGDKGLRLQMEALARAVLAQETRPTWQPIETAPKNIPLLLWDAKRQVAVSGRWCVEPTLDSPNGYEPGWAGWSCDDDLIIWDDHGPTHWMPLDPPPDQPQ